MGTEFRAALRAVINDLTGVPARWLAAGLLGLDLALLLTIIVVDHKVDAHDLRHENLQDWCGLQVETANASIMPAAPTSSAHIYACVGYQPSAECRKMAPFGR